MVKKRERPISRAILRTELSFAVRLIDEMNFGYAKEIIEKALKRVEKYDLK